MNINNNHWINTHELVRILVCLCLITIPFISLLLYQTNTQIQFQIFHISKFSRTRQLFHDKHNREQQTNRAHHNIAPAKEQILPSKPIRCRDHHSLIDMFFHVEIYRSFHSTNKLAKIRTFRSVFAGMSCSIRPYSFRKCGSAAARIHTIKCSFSTPPPLYDAECGSSLLSFGIRSG